MTWRSPSSFPEDEETRAASGPHAQMSDRGAAGERGVGGPVNVLLTVNDMSQVGAARRGAVALATQIDMTEEGVGTVAIVATELAANLARHARDGFMLLRVLQSCGTHGIEMLSVDRGPGISNIDGALRDGFSTRGTPGKGLGAVARLATEFEVWSSTKPHVPVSGLAAAALARGTGAPLGLGSVVLARLWRSPRGVEAPRPSLRREAGVVCLPFHGESVCGDAWLVARREATTIIVIDGLGHGRDAAIAADTAIRCARGAIDGAPAEIIRDAHGALRATRGAAMAVARIDHGSRSVRFSGIGNIAGTIMSGGNTRGLASGNGIVGHQFGHVHEFAYDWPLGSYLVMHTDGVSARWQGDAYISLLGHDPSLLAASLYRDYARSHDDQTVLVISDPIVQEQDR